eukprot:COSAG03_NODE_1234_length_4497_cov_83.406810_5_plen_109_part_00
MAVSLPRDARQLQRTVVEAVDAVDRRALVVAAQHEEILGVPDLVTQEQHDHLDALLPAVDVIAQEEVVRLWRVAAKLEQSQQIGVLSALTHDVSMASGQPIQLTGATF